MKKIVHIYDLDIKNGDQLIKALAKQGEDTHQFYECESNVAYTLHECKVDGATHAQIWYGDNSAFNVVVEL